MADFNVTTSFAYFYAGLVYFNVYRNGVYQFQGTQEDIDDYLDLLNSQENK